MHILHNTSVSSDATWNGCSQLHRGTLLGKSRSDVYGRNPRPHLEACLGVWQVDRWGGREEGLERGGRAWTLQPRASE